MGISAYKVQALRGHHASSLSHIWSGIRILEGLQAQEISNSLSGANANIEFRRAPREKFEVLFNRLDSQINQVCVLAGCAVIPAHGRSRKHTDVRFEVLSPFRVLFHATKISTPIQDDVSWIWSGNSRNFFLPRRS